MNRRSGPQAKLVLAFVQPFKLDAVTQSLEAIPDFPGMSVTEVRGFGRERSDPDLRGAPTGFGVPVREVRLAAGAGFVVVICGEIMTMPGLPRAPSAEGMRLNEAGLIEGLF